MVGSITRIPFNRPFIAGKELYYVAQAVIGSHLSGGGPFSKRCQAWLEENLGCKKALLTHSCTGALEMAAILCDIKPGDEVIMPSFTFVSTANAFVLRGGVPVFVDIRSDTLNLDETLIESAITERTKVIVPVHYAGMACAMDEIMEVAQKHGLLVVEDAAQALLSNYRGRALGAIGHLGCLSFHETKNIISGEGGALIINDETFLERAEIIWEKGTDRSKFFRGEVDKYTWIDIGSSFLPSDMVGAFLFGQLERAKKINAVRRRLYEQYYGALSPLADQGVIRLPFVENDDLVNGHLFYIITRTPPERAALIQFLDDDDILAVSHYEPLHSSPAGRRYGRVGSDMQVTEEISSRLLRLPLFYELAEAQVERVVGRVFEFYRK
jgi:dTDP-4-amino-4,6-dideoxygalactose transaminase